MFAERAARLVLSEEVDDGGCLYGVLLLDDWKQLLFVLLEVQEILGDETRLR